MRILGWGLPNRFKEETSSFTALFRGSRECLSGFKYQQLSLGVLAGVTSGGWDGRTAAHGNGRYENQPGMLRPRALPALP